MRVTWIGGWGVAPEALRPLAGRFFPAAEHTFRAPTPGSLAPDHPIARRDATPSPIVGEGMERFTGRERSGPTASTALVAPDVTIAWSLGAWRVLEAASRGVEFPGMVLLLAPFVAFPAEAGLGGKCSATQVKFLRRWLRRDPLAAIADFHRRAGLSGSVARAARPHADNQTGDEARGTPAPHLPYVLSDLIEGLDRLAGDAPPGLREFAASGLPRNWQAFIGDADPLLDAGAVRCSLPGCVRTRRAGHDIVELLRHSGVAGG